MQDISLSINTFSQLLRSTTDFSAFTLFSLLPLSMLSNPILSIDAHLFASLGDTFSPACCCPLKLSCADSWCCWGTLASAATFSHNEQQPPRVAAELWQSWQLLLPSKSKCRPCTLPTMRHAACLPWWLLFSSHPHPRLVLFLLQLPAAYNCCVVAGFAACLWQHLMNA